MSDKELLELAAKAAGLKFDHYETGNGFFHDDETREGVYDYWNPLTDDGDALRLAVKLNLLIHIDLSATDVRDDYQEFCTVAVVENHNGDPYAATSRAIVRAAAEVGKNMMSHDEFILMFPGRFDNETVEAAEIGKEK